MRNVLEFIQKNWIRFVVSLAIGLAISIIYMSVNTYLGSWKDIMFYCNATFIASFLLFAIGVLTLLNNFGGFDIFSFLIMRKPYNEARKENLYEYSERKKEERKKYKLVFLPYLIVCSLFLIASLILYFIIIF